MKWNAFRPALLLTLLGLVLGPVGAHAGNLLVASTTPADGITGYAYDPAAGAVYTSVEFGTAIVGPGGRSDIATGSLLDMAFGGGFIWAGETNFAGGVSLARIDPQTFAVLNEYDLGTETVSDSGLVIPIMGSGVAWDGTGLWISNNPFGSPEAIAAGIVGTSIAKWVWDEVPDTLTQVDGSSFTPWLDRTPGGLAWDAGRLLIGTDSGQIYSYDGGLSANPVFTADGDFVQGLEAVPEPGTLLLIGSALAGLVFYRRKRG